MSKKKFVNRIMLGSVMGITLKILLFLTASKVQPIGNSIKPIGYIPKTTVNIITIVKNVVLVVMIVLIFRGEVDTEISFYTLL